MSEPIFQESKAEVAGSRENDQASQPDLKRMLIKAVVIKSTAKDDIVDH